MIFNWEFYITYNEDLWNSGINNEESAYEHFKNFGINERRIYCNIVIFFNWKKYISINVDLKHIKNEDDAWRHFLYHGKKENRKINDEYFLKQYCI
jgi:hypothetical protein